MTARRSIVEQLRRAARYQHTDAVPPSWPQAADEPPRCQHGVLPPTSGSSMVPNLLLCNGSGHQLVLELKDG